MPLFSFVFIFALAFLSFSLRTIPAYSAKVFTNKCNEESSLECVCHLVLDGKIKSGDVAALKKSARNISENDFIRICLTSSGGDWFVAREIRDYLIKHRIGTVVKNGDECTSACAYIFLAGNTGSDTIPTRPDRLLKEGGKLGFHSPFPPKLRKDGLVDYATLSLISNWLYDSFDSRGAAYGNGGKIVADALLHTPDSFHWIQSLESAAMANITFEPRNAKALDFAEWQLFVSDSQIRQLCTNVFQWNRGVQSYTQKELYEDVGRSQKMSVGRVIRRSRYLERDNLGDPDLFWLKEYKKEFHESTELVRSPIYLVDIHHDFDGAITCAVMLAESGFDVCFNCFDKPSETVLRRGFAHDSSRIYPWYFVLGPQTPLSEFSELFSSVFIPKRSSTDLLALRIQTVMQNLGFYTGTLDGIWGEKSKQALTEVETALNKRENTPEYASTNGKISDELLYNLQTYLLDQ